MKPPHAANKTQHTQINNYLKWQKTLYTGNYNNNDKDDKIVQAVTLLAMLMMPGKYKALESERS